jgi:hypothetical protein
MRPPFVRLILLFVPSLMLAAAVIPAAGPKSSATTSRLDSLDGLEIINVKAEATTYRGKRSVRLLESSAEPVRTHSRREPMAILRDSDFKNGTIEAEIAGAPRQGAAPDMRGFVGIAFRSQDHGGRFECFYVRFTNGRAEDQLRRNHSVQYVSEPEFPWERLRKETPGAYESYTDLEPGAWTKIKIVVAGTKARLYINGADQPCLIVNDLKLGDVQGPIALWVGAETDAYFTDLTVK